MRDMDMLHLEQKTKDSYNRAVTKAELRNEANKKNSKMN